MTAVVNPGHYLRLRRQTAGVELADVAARFHTEPRVDELSRIELLRQIEADRDVAALTIAAAAAYGASHVRFDPRVLIALVPPLPIEPPDICGTCGCSWHDPCCTDQHGTGCYWVAANLCSACADRPAAEAQAA